MFNIINKIYKKLSYYVFKIQQQLDYFPWKFQNFINEKLSILENKLSILENRLPLLENIAVETNYLKIELHRQRNISNKIILRQLKSLSENTNDGFISYSFQRVTNILQPGIIERSKKIILVSVALGQEYRNTVKECLKSHQIYSERHNYSYAELSVIPNVPDRPYPWYKIAMTKKMLDKGYENILFIDADCLITNYNIKIESLVFNLDRSQKSMLIAEDAIGINTGCFLIKNNYKSEKILDLIWNYDHDKFHGNWEQNALVNLIHDHPEVFEEIYIEKNANLLNSYPNEMCKFHPLITYSPNIWKPGDFLCHFASMRSPHLEVMIQQYVEKTREEK